MKVAIVPWAITRVDDASACVGAIAADGEWIRPEPVAAGDVDGSNAIYRYGRWTEIDVAPSTAVDRRPEDRSLCGRAHLTGASLSNDERIRWLESLASPSAERSLDGRSLAVVKARVEGVYLKASVGKKTFVRMCFADETGARFDWIVPEVRFGARARGRVVGGAIDAAWSRRVIEELARRTTYLALGLTKPNERFPGKFGGCHPLVVGVHTAPDDVSRWLED